MKKKIQKTGKLKLPILISSILIMTCFIIIDTQDSKSSSHNNSTPIQNSITYESGIVILENQTILDDIIIKFTASVSLINSTLQGSIYMFNTGNLFLLQNSNLTQNIVISDYSTLTIDNSTIGGSIECRDSTTMGLLDCHTITTTVWKFDYANIVINGSLFAILNEFGIGGIIQIINSQITLVSLNGMPSSRTFITNSKILTLNDLVFPSSVITGPVRFSFLTFNISYSTSERIINLTWIGWDSPIIDGYLNITFQIYLDNQFYGEINGSGLHDQYSSFYLIQISDPGEHNISVVSIDSMGNKFISSIIIELLNYPSFQWIPFFLIIAISIGIVAVIIIWVKRKQNRGYFSSLGTIFKAEIAAGKKKLLILTLTSAAPGIILFFSFGLINRLIGSISIDGIRDLINIFFSLYITYFGLIFSIAVGAGSVAGAKRNGSLSWFFSKPVRRWEFLWGKIFAFIVMIVITMLCVSLSFVLGAIFFVDPIYIPDILSIGGYIFLIGLIALLPLTAIVIFSSSVFKKIGLAYFIPIMVFMAMPTIISFLTILARGEWPLLFSFTYYFEQLGKVWISNTGGLFGSIGSYGELLGISIAPLALSTTTIILIMVILTIIFLGLATAIFQKQDIP
ncbi:MAG: ABC transporter permease [Promethearchaeota archaeon]|jgi:ABC-type transport system involved in multi-copper enzyme maturation permease subunit